MTFNPGETITVREVWGGHEWLRFPERVVSDGEVLATLLESGTPLTFPEHPGGPLPWSQQTHWQGTRGLELRRSHDWYSVWKFFDLEGAFLRWYVNFERPYVRRSGGIDVDDLELDLVVHPDGRREWKDVEVLDERMAEGRFSIADLQQVLVAAPIVTGRLDLDQRWWSPWDGWTPPPARSGTMAT